MKIKKFKMKINNLILCDFLYSASSGGIFMQYPSEVVFLPMISGRGNLRNHPSASRGKFKRKPEVVFLPMISGRGNLRNHPSASRGKFKRKPEVVF